MTRSTTTPARPRRRALVAFSVALAGLFAVSTAVAGGGLRDILRGSDVIEAEADQRLEALDRQIDGLRGFMDDLPRHERRKLRRSIRHMEELVAHLEDDTDALAGLVIEAAKEARPNRRVSVDPRGVYRPYANARTACSKSDFADVLQSVENAWFDDGKLEVLRDASAHRWFTVVQVKTLVAQFSFSDAQVDAAAMLHGRTLDVENWYRVYDSLTFDSSKRELRKRVGA